MNYANIQEAVFIDRPNRFIANIEINGNREICHVKNTGRCKELLVPGARIFVTEPGNPNRKTKYDLIAVEKGERLINMDAQAPNKIFEEWAKEGNFIGDITLIKAEKTYKTSRFDFYLETGKGARKIYVEVKGVTLEEDGIVRFPDAPTERGIKHLNELSEAAAEGYEAWAVFVIQMQDVKHFEPNVKTHKAFGEALVMASEKGVNLLALDCKVTSGTIVARRPVEIVLK